MTEAVIYQFKRRVTPSSSTAAIELMFWWPRFWFSFWGLDDPIKMVKPRP